MSDEIGGYDKEIFVDQQHAEVYLCAICQGILRKATSIGCQQEHVFCNSCFEEYFRNEANERCPICRESGLSRDGMRVNKSMDRVINGFKVKCKLQHDEEQSNEDEDVQDNKAAIRCDWTGALGDLSEHIKNHCALFRMKCAWCKTQERRYRMEEHDQECADKPVPCTLNCNQMIKRRLMEKHTNEECGMLKVVCNHCKEELLNKDLLRHRRSMHMESIYRLRRHQMDSTIVRVMKRRRTMSHGELGEEVTVLLQPRFKPKPVDIKKRICMLIELEYLERDENDHALYHYKP